MVLLAGCVKNIELQDSLQRLARMSETERLACIDRIIEEVIKKEKEEQKEAERAARMAEHDEQNADSLGEIHECVARFCGGFWHRRFLLAFQEIKDAFLVFRKLVEHGVTTTFIHVRFASDAFSF